MQVFAPVPRAPAPQKPRQSPGHRHDKYPDKSPGHRHWPDAQLNRGHTLFGSHRATGLRMTREGDNLGQGTLD